MNRRLRMVSNLFASSRWPIIPSFLHSFVLCQPLAALPRVTSCDRYIGTGPSPLSVCVSCGAWTVQASRNPSVVWWWTNSTAVVVWRSCRVCHPWSWTQGWQGLKMNKLLGIHCYHMFIDLEFVGQSLYDPHSVARLTCHMTALLCSLLAPQLHDLRAKEVIVVARAFSPERIPDVFWSRCLDLPDLMSSTKLDETWRQSQRPWLYVYITWYYIYT